MAAVQQVAEPHRDYTTLSTKIAAPRGSGKMSAAVRDGNTVLTLPDSSTLAFVGSASLDQITFLGWKTTTPS